MITLYHYIHCPYYLRVRMALGFFNLEYHSIVLPYEDEQTPINLMGEKMLPIFKTGSITMNESIEIIKKLDDKKQLLLSYSNDELNSFNDYLSTLGKPIHSLAMPYWVYTEEFSQASREYFIKKKEIKRGPFKNLFLERERFTQELNPKLKEIEEKLMPYYQNTDLGIKDIMLASHLWGLYIVPEFQFSENMHRYLMNVKKVTKFEYHQDFWK